MGCIFLLNCTGIGGMKIKLLMYEKFELLHPPEMKGGKSSLCRYPPSASV